MLGCKAPFLKSPFVVPTLKCCFNQCLRCFKKGDQLALWGWEGRGNSDNSYFSGTLPVGTSAWANLARHFYLGASIHIGQSSKNRYFWSRPKIVGQRGETDGQLQQSASHQRHSCAATTSSHRPHLVSQTSG